MNKKKTRDVIAIIYNKDGKIIGVGRKSYTQDGKSIHAEINACRNIKIKSDANDNLLYLIGTDFISEENKIVLKAAGVKKYVIGLISKTKHLI